MQNDKPPPLACLDADIFLAVLIPEVTKKLPKKKLPGQNECSKQ